MKTTGAKPHRTLLAAIPFKTVGAHIALVFRGKKKPQISPLGCAPVEMTILSQLRFRISPGKAEFYRRTKLRFLFALHTSSKSQSPFHPSRVRSSYKTRIPQDEFVVPDRISF
jgi:hypothetical protein